MIGRLAYYSPGLRRLAAEMGVLSGLRPEFRIAGAGAAEAIAGWGHKPTAARARAMARRKRLPYFAFEDGFLRSVRPGPAEPPASMIIDRTGIYYDARQPSDLETLLETAHFSDSERAQAAELIACLARHRLSKYNHGHGHFLSFALPKDKPLVIIADQTRGDESIAGALSDAADFDRMIEAAVAENPGAHIVARLHPETVAGTKPGYLLDAARRLGLPLLAEPVSPWCLLERRPVVYTVSSQLGFEALLAGCTVRCFGLPFYAGWGLTQDEKRTPRRTATRSLQDLAAASYLRYARYFDSWKRTPVDALTAADQLAFRRRTFLANTTPVIGYRIARWKRRAVAAMLDGPAGPPRFTSSLADAKVLARRSNAAIAAWGITALRLRKQVAPEKIAVIAVEDGFLRSVGLGAAFVEPLSLVFDRTGLYFDPTEPSDIETMLREAVITDAEKSEAAALAARIRAERITKYNIAAESPGMIAPPDRDIILVPGQVADDWAVRTGRPKALLPDTNINAWLLERVRAAHPDAFVIFKPHPDVEQLGRAGGLDAHQERHADVIARKTAMDSLLPLANRIETYSSLAGFEGLLRGVPVAVHGVPFYAGWGLTTDRARIERRGTPRSLDELTAVALLRYPRYWDPLSGLCCPPGVVLDRLAAGRGRAGGARKHLLNLAGRLVIVSRHIGQWIRGSGHGGQ